MARASRVLPSCTGPAHHEHALGDLAAELLEFARILEEVDDLRDFLLGLIDAGDVGERDVHLIFSEQARAALAERHGPPAARGALHLPQHVHEDQDQEQRRRELQQQLREEIRLLRRQPLDADVALLQRADQRGVVGSGL